MQFPDGPYGDGKRQIDHCKAENARDAIRMLTKLTLPMREGSPERDMMEARIGRQAIELAIIEERLNVH